jgi:predicted ATPase
MPLHFFPGKTSVVNECHRPMVRSRAFFCREKFDLYRRCSVVLLECFQSVMHHLIACPPTERELWRTQLLASLEGKGALLVAVIPQLASVVGPQETSLRQSLPEREAAFTSTFLRFVGALAQPAHPLVLFIDDLQCTRGKDTALMHSVFAIDLLTCAP